MNFAIIGCGLIGQKRLRALRQQHSIIATADLNLPRAEALAAQCPGAVSTADWSEAVHHPSVEAVIVATTNNWLAPITLASVQAGKHVLVEKPAARTAEELRPALAAARNTGAQVQVGFNHRFHPALQKAREIFETGALGPLMFIRGRYGHGGRIGYDREWRADPAIGGGGELLDQGVHLIDLARWFLGDFTLVDGHTGTYFWDMPVDDNAFLSLRTKDGKTAWLHASCTEWKNMFSFEIYGRDGKLQVDGLGGSYGVERLTYYRMLPQMGPPETTIWEYPGEDSSWKLELSTFLASVKDGVSRGPGLEDALAVLEIVDTIYGSRNE
jgi:predicted dehydrogenase